MVLKAAVVCITGGLMGSGLVALTRLGDEPQSGGRSLSPISTATASAEFHHETNRQGYVQARFAAQHPFAALRPVTRQ